MTEPSGKIVARPMVVRACGHQQEFQHYAVDKYRAQRLTKFQRTRCAECAAKLVEEQQRAARRRAEEKGEAPKLSTGHSNFPDPQPDGGLGILIRQGGTTVGEAGRRSGGRGVRPSLSRWPDSGARRTGVGGKQE